MGEPLAYRRLASRTHVDVQRQVEHIERRVHETVTHEIHRRMTTQTAVNEAVLSPQLLSRLTDSVFGAIERRFAIERYRRGY